MSIKQQIMQRLSDGQPHSTKELATITHRVSGVIYELREEGREEGYEITTITISHNNYAYQLMRVSSVA